MPKTVKTVFLCYHCLMSTQHQKQCLYLFLGFGIVPYIVLKLWLRYIPTPIYLATFMESVNLFMFLILGAIAVIIYLIWNVYIPLPGHKRFEALRIQYLTSTLDKDAQRSLELMDDANKERFFEQYKFTMTNAQRSEYHQAMNEIIRNDMPSFFRTLLIAATVFAIGIGLWTFRIPIYNFYDISKLYHEKQVVAYDKYYTPVYNTFIQKDGLPLIQVFTDKGVAQGRVDDYIENYISVQPDFLLENCKKINLCDSDAFYKTLKNNNMSTQGWIYAFAQSDTMEITMQLHLSEYDLHSVSHELAHLYDFENHISDTNTWQALYYSRPASLRLYSAKDPSEFFADATAYYIWRPDDLKSANPELYEVLNNLFHLY